METVLTGSVRYIVNYTAGTDARETIVDGKTGAKIRINIDGLDEATEQDELFYIESPSGDMLYDAYDRREAMKLLSNIRKGMKYPDMDTASFYPPKRTVKKAKSESKSRKRMTGTPASLTGTRRLI